MAHYLVQVAYTSEAWANPAPCEGWTARDVVRHLVEWIPAFFSGYAGLPLATGPSVELIAFTGRQP